MKRLVIPLIVNIVIGGILIGLGLWYIAKSIKGTSIPYASLPRFLESIGVCKDGVCDIAGANGCFICPYVTKLFLTIGKATESLWDVIIDHTWIILVIGTVAFMFWKAYEVIMTANKQNASLGTGGRTLHFKQWFDAVKNQVVRVMVVAALLGAAGFGGRGALQAVADTAVYPVMYVGTTLALAATEVGKFAECGVSKTAGNNPMAGVADSFACIIGNINTVILSGANTGFSMMNLAWMGDAEDDRRGGFIMWLAGLIVVLLFMYIGYNILFKVLNIIFNLVFVIIFIPLFLAAFAFEKSWKAIEKVSSGALGILAKTAVRAVGVTIEVMIMYSLVNYAMMETMSSPSNYALEFEIIQRCENEAVSTDAEGGTVVDKKIYAECFNAEVAANPGAFEYVKNGGEFLITMLFLFLVYFLLIDKKLQKIIDMSDGGAYFKFGDNLKMTFEQLLKVPNIILKKLPTGGKGKAAAKGGGGGAPKSAPAAPKPAGGGGNP